MVHYYDIFINMFLEGNPAYDPHRSDRGGPVHVHGVCGQWAEKVLPAITDAAAELGVPVIGMDVLPDGDAVHRPFVNQLLYRNMSNPLEVKGAREGLRCNPPSVVYILTPPDRHVPVAQPYLDGEIDPNRDTRVLIEKPLTDKRAGVQAADALPDTHRRVRVHDHYPNKGIVWGMEQVCVNHPELGVPQSVQFIFLEPQTAESEGRVQAFSCGAMLDLGVHALSVLDRFSSVWSKQAGMDEGLLCMPRIKRVQLGRYSPSQLPGSVETFAYVQYALYVPSRPCSPVNVEIMVGKGVGEAQQKNITFAYGQGAEPIVADLRTSTISGLPPAMMDTVGSLRDDPRWRDVRGTYEGLKRGLLGDDAYFLNYAHGAQVVGMAEDATVKGMRGMREYSPGTPYETILAGL